MATKRGNVWYTKRSYPGVGKMEKSLHTPSKARAEYLERMLIGLPSQGLTGVLRAFDEGKVSIPPDRRSVGIWVHSRPGRCCSHRLDDAC